MKNRRRFPEGGYTTQAKDYGRTIIEICAPGAGFVLTGGASVDEGNPENLQAMLDAAKE